MWSSRGSEREVSHDNPVVRQSIRDPIAGRGSQSVELDRAKTMSDSNNMRDSKSTKKTLRVARSLDTGGESSPVRDVSQVGTLPTDRELLSGDKSPSDGTGSVDRNAEAV